MKTQSNPVQAITNLLLLASDGDRISLDESAMHMYDCWDENDDEIIRIVEIMAQRLIEAKEAK